MALKLFYELGKEKRNKIIHTAMLEFAQYGFDGSSTNRIVKAAGISKGSLYKYFSSKQELYFDVLDTVIQNYVSYLEKSISGLSEDIYERAIMLALTEFSWYAKHPDYYKLFKKAFLDSPEAYQMSIEKYGRRASEIFYGMFGAQNSAEGNSGKKLNILKWFLEGFNRDFIEKSDINISIVELEKKYIIELRDYIGIMKTAIK